MNSLPIQTLRTILLGAVVFAALLFLPAWTFNYWQAWVFMVVFLGAGNALGIYLALTDPALLERRKYVGPRAEQRTAQKIIISLAFAGMGALFVFSALDHRFGWSPVSPLVSLAGDVLVALGFVIFFVVFRENTYGASSIQVAEDQRVISTGPYSIVRHPMYAGFWSCSWAFPSPLTHDGACS